MVQARREFSILTKLGSRDGSGLAPSRGRHFSHLPQGPHLISFQSSATRRWSIFHRVSCVGSTRPVRDRTSPATSRARSEKRTTNRPNPLAARLSKTVERSEESPGLLFAGTNATIFKVCRDCTSSSCCFAAFVRQTRFELPARQAVGTLSLCTLRALLSTPSALCSLTLAPPLSRAWVTAWRTDATCPPWPSSLIIPSSHSHQAVSFNAPLH
jgi:hypothetical protein